MAVPPALQKAHIRWDMADRRAQSAISWPRHSWEKHFNEIIDGVDLANVLSKIPDDSIDRQKATDLAKDVQSPEDAVTAFVAAMVWGYGPVGYGAWRTKRIFSENKDAVEQLLETAKIAQSEGGLAAFRHIASKRGEAGGYLKYLGPAFGTKYIYFLTKASGKDTSPVLDSIVQRWFAKHDPETPLNVVWWEPASYERYLDRLEEWAEDLGVDTNRPLALDDVEHLIFTPEFERTDEEQASPQALLDLLAEEAEALEATRGDDGTRLVRELQEWFEGAETIGHDRELKSRRPDRIKALVGLMERIRTRVSVRHLICLMQGPAYAR